LLEDEVYIKMINSPNTKMNQINNLGLGSELMPSRRRFIGNLSAIVAACHPLGVALSGQEQDVEVYKAAEGKLQVVAYNGHYFLASKGTLNPNIDTSNQDIALDQMIYRINSEQNITSIRETENMGFLRQLFHNLNGREDIDLIRLDESQGFNINPSLRVKIEHGRDYYWPYLWTYQ
jgi:hypothetical protein